MEILIVTLSSILLTALLGLLGQFLKRALNKVDDIGTQIAAHETADEVLTVKVDGLIQRVDGLDKRFDRTDYRLDRMDDKLDRLLEKAA